MRLLKLSVPLAILALAAAACDGDNTPGATAYADDSASDPNAGVAIQPAGNTATQPAGNTATQPAGNTATQPAGNTATDPTSPGSGGVSVENCTSVCNHVAALACSDDAEAEATDCAGDCANVGELPSACASSMNRLLSCAAAASSCTALAACEALSEAFQACADGGSIDPGEPPPPPTTGTTPTISDTANCYTSNVCAGCTSTCDTCVCGYLYLDYSSAEIATNCGTLCSSSG